MTCLDHALGKEPLKFPNTLWQEATVALGYVSSNSKPRTCIHNLYTHTKHELKQFSIIFAYLFCSFFSAWTHGFQINLPCHTPQLWEFLSVGNLDLFWIHYWNLSTCWTTKISLHVKVNSLTLQCLCQLHQELILIVRTCETHEWHKTKETKKSTK